MRRRLAVLLLLAACAPTSPGTPLLAFVEGAEIQAENDAQACELASALDAIAAGPVDRVMTLRFSDAAGRSGALTAAGVLDGFLVPSAPAAVSHAPETYAGAAEPRTHAALIAKSAEARAGRRC
jgi:hypothetical protein